MNSPWKPERAVQIVAGTPPGGGLDRVARALAKACRATGLVSVPVEVVNIPGDGARRAWTHYVDDHPGDGHVIGISSPNLTTDYLVGAASFEHSKYTPIATLVIEYIAFAVKSEAPLKTGADLLARLGQNPSSGTVALSTALGNPNHVALAQLTRHAGGDVNAPTIRVFDTALDAVADVVDGKSYVCAVTAASVLAELNAGRLRVLGVSAPERLSGASPRRRRGKSSRPVASSARGAVLPGRPDSRPRKSRIRKACCGRRRTSRSGAKSCRA
jgi:putative tricarboxylic transport membrane protein